MFAIMCRKCAMDCDASYPLVYRYIRENKEQDISIDSIANGTKIPRTFIKGLIMEGRFESVQINGSPDRKAVQKQIRDKLRLKTQQSNTENETSKTGYLNTSSMKVTGSKRYGLGRR